MDKLIDYTGLETFHTNLLNDNATSELATWSSKKINTSKQNKLTVGNNISISGDTISADGYVFNSSLGSFATTYIYNDNLVANIASGLNSHAEGFRTVAAEEDSHTEGEYTQANGKYSHAEGENTKANGNVSHAEGSNTKANGGVSHAEGQETQTQNHTEHAEGFMNVSHKASDTYGDGGNTQHSIGIGFLQNQTQLRRNAVEVMQNCDYYLYGVGNYDGIHIKNEQGAPSNLQTLQEVIAALEARIAALENANA